MNWKQKTIVRILMMVAKMLSEDESMTAELQHLSNHITTNREKD